MDLSRADQLRALGNGLVPIVAALAFLTLTNRAPVPQGELKLIEEVGK